MRTRQLYARTRSRRVVFSACLATLLVACKHAPPAPSPPKPRIVAITLESSADLNPDSDGRASPVVLRLYQLSSTDDFLNAEFVALYRNDAATLGRALIAKKELAVLPGEHSTIKLELAGDARSLGVLVAYRDIDHATWRLTGTTDQSALRLSLGAKSAMLQSQR
jgi:type VI secretion system protein VasD